jgi:hypothetical protein
VITLNPRLHIPTLSEHPLVIGEILRRQQQREVERRISRVRRIARRLSTTMKKQYIIIVAAVCLGAQLAFAQTVSTPSASPGGAPSPENAPVAPKAGMALPAQTQAALVAGEIISKVNTLLNNALQAIDNGVPAQEGTPAIAATDIQAAIGSENIMRLRSAVAILSGSAPQPSPAPAKK